LKREERLFEHLKVLHSKAYVVQLRAELTVCVILGMTVAGWEATARKSYRRLRDGGRCQHLYEWGGKIRFDVIRLPAPRVNRSRLPGGYFDCNRPEKPEFVIPPLMIRALCYFFFLFATTPLFAEPPVQFNRDIRPILSDRCYYCHGPDEKTQKADLRLDTREGALADGAIVPGKPEESELFYRITTDDEDDVMPQPKAKKPKLNAHEIALFKRWIEEGAEYQGHWAFEPVAKIETPAGAHPVDHFINKRLAKEGIESSPAADRATLIRRVYLDLIGLLPSREQVDAFVKDSRADAYQQIVDELLASRHYGERWGRHWLDGARYADSHGYSVDGARQMWPYRDWVIRAFNDDMPFDQFTIEQIAGDLLPDPSQSQLVATAFHRNTLINQEGGSDPEQFRVEATIDRTNTTGAVWLGLTVGCAQCHTHKFDPLQHREYYELFSFFNNAEDRNNTGPTVEVAEGELFEKVITTPHPEPQSKKTLVEPNWKTANYREIKTGSGAALHKQKDNSLLIDKKFGNHDTYQITSDSGLEKLAAVRLRTLTDQSLPRNGPGTAANGNFVLTNIKILVAGIEQPISGAFSDAEQKGYPVAHAFDRDKKSGWAINIGTGKGKMNSNHEAIFILAKPVETKGQQVEVRLFHDLHPDYLIGRFAIDFTDTAPSRPAKAMPEQSVTGKVMVMRDLKTPRDAYILTRGDFTRPDKEKGKLSPGVFAAIAPRLPESDQPRNRMDLANWLVHPDNPLTSRVTVNRMWMRYFGRGLVETEEDFGSQGDLPSHPELLDALAIDFRNSGWDIKALLKKMLLSATYRQSIRSNEKLQEIDPDNIYLARGPSNRLSAEMLRDHALVVSGLLSEKVGGPSVKPYHPEGLWLEIASGNQPLRKYIQDHEEDLYRRSMYTFWKRTVPPPSMITFDAPSREECIVRRQATSTPMQALVLLNDPQFTEASRLIAERMLREGGNQISEQIAFAFRLTTSRSPSSEEIRLLEELLEKKKADFEQEPAKAEQYLNIGEYPRTAEFAATKLAAYTLLANAILNLTESIQKG